MRITLYVVTLATVFLSATIAHAAEAQKIVPITLDPARAYVLVRMGERTPNLWNILSLAAYDEKLEDLRGKGRAKANPVVKPADRVVIIGPKSHLDEKDHVRTYLVAMTPGRYVIAGGPTTCFCLGSYQFEAVAGRITDLGTVYIGPENGASSWAALTHLRSSPDIEERGYTVADAMAVYRWTKKMTVPSALAGFPHAAADYNAARRFGNHSGQLLNRALPLDLAK